MATIVTIAAGDQITNSRADLNTNFTNLNSDKIETSVIDTDTALAANSDTKIPSQKAVKTYIDTSGGANASVTVRGIVEEATAAEVTAQTAAGATGARLFVNPSTMGGALVHAVGAMESALVKTYFNFQLLFILWIGAVVNDTTTTFANWVRSDATDVVIPTGGAFVRFNSVGAASLTMAGQPFYNGDGGLTFSNSNTVIMDFWAKLVSGTGDFFMGFFDDVAASTDVYNSSTYNKVAFIQNAGGTLYATIAKAGTGVTNTSVSTGITLTNFNNYRIELDLSNNALFYINGVLKATLSGANFPTANVNLALGFGRSDTALANITAPTLGVEMAGI